MMENIDIIDNLRIVIKFPDNKMIFFRITENDYVKIDEKNN